MTKTLTEQWRDGILPVGNYYIKLVGDVERIDFFEGLEWEMTKDFGIEEVVATVPSYDEYKELVSKTDKLEKMAFHYTPEEWNTMMRMVERLQEQLKEANELLRTAGYGSKENIYPFPYVCPEECRNYLKKWGVK